MSFNVLYVFMWKHFKRIRYYWKSVSLSIILPVALISILLYYSSHPVSYSNEIHEPILLNFPDSSLHFPSGIEDKVLYYPETEYYKNLMGNVSKKLDVYEQRLMGFTTERQLMTFYDSTNESSVFAVLFDDNKTQNSSLQYAIRTKNNNFDTENFYASSTFYSSYRGGREYKTSGFLALQHAINTAFIENIDNKTTFIYELEQNPAMHVKSPKTVVLFSWTTILCFMVVFLTITLQPIVEEKQDGIKEILNIATTNSFLNQVALFFTNTLFCIVLIIVFVGQAIYYDIFDCTSVVVATILLILYCCCMICFTCFMSVFFDTVNFASLIGFVFYFIPILLFDLDLGSKFITNFQFLSPNTMYLHGMNIFDRYLNTQRCFSFKNFFDTSYPIVDYSMFQIYISLILTSILYAFLYYYLSNVFPGKYGTPKPFYFLCMPSFYSRNKPRCVKTSNSVDNNLNETEIIRIENLTKEFSTLPCQAKKKAVNDTTFSLPTNQITALLGHNGAGKTTTMMMIVGIIPPTCGKIYVDGIDDVSVYRNSIGYCPQNDVFIRYMNCEEHLLLFGRLRGLSNSEAQEEATVILEKVKLTASKNKAASTLSSGMKRRLCLAAAVIGKTKVVILDEPSSGLDPESRRDLWDILLPLRKERSILLTTHSMEEADVLGDKIIIMDHGNVLCQGTPIQLKKKYGTGYTLKIMMTENFKMDETLNIIQKNVPTSSVKAHIFPTISVSLPYEFQDKFTETLKKIEDDKTNLGIESLSMTNTTMEEVFLNSASHTKDPITSEDQTDSKYIRIEDQHEEENIQKSTIVNEFVAIFYKKLIYLKRSWIKFTILVFFPIIAVILGLYIPNSYKDSLDEKVTYPSRYINALDVPNLNILLVTNITDNKLVNMFKQLATEEHKSAKIYYNQSIENVLMEIESNEIIYYHENIMAGLEINKNNDNTYKIKSIFNGNLAHSSAYAVNLATNFVLKIIDKGNHNVEVINSPLQRGDYQYINLSQIFLFMSFVEFLTFGMFAYMLFYISLPFIEEQTEFKILQNISPIVFWLTTYVFDMIIHSLVCVIIYITIIICDKYDIMSESLQAYIFFVILIYGFVYIPILYVLPKLFKTLSSVYSLLFYALLVSSISSVFFMDERVMQGFEIAGFLLFCLPDFRLMIQLFSLFSTAMTSYDEISRNSYDVLRYCLFSLFNTIFFLILLIFILENVYIIEKIKNLVYCKKKKTTINNYIPLVSDSYVLTEKNLVSSVISENRQENYVLVVSELEKNYYSKKAVNKISFTVQKGECFGLLGMNGAGKSTTFKMMTLNTAITSGDIFLNGYHSQRNKSDYKTKFGYCPEMSALLDFMTAYETLKYMAWLKGTPYNRLDDDVKQWIKKLDLEKYTNMQVQSYSGGTKRKLNTAISMITSPLLIFLDEPTSGVDPMSRRFMWKCIKEFQKEMKTIVLTSHSMDECEELCNRLGIMAAGQFECIGFIQKLKMLFGKGFTLFVKVKETIPEDELKKIKLQITEMYRCTLRDDYAGTLTYNVLETDIPWSIVFQKITDFYNRNEKYIEDYAITEVTLEDIFLHFRQNQNAVTDL